MMRKCAFLTLADRGDYFIDDELAYAPMREAGWDVVAIPWDSTTTDWSQFDLIVIRSTWDYQLKPARFLTTLRQIETSGTRLENPSDVVAWNMQKTYLLDLEQKGVDIVPARFGQSLEQGQLDGFFNDFSVDEIVIKPQIGATASGAFRLRQQHLSPDRRKEVEIYYQATPFLVQPFQKYIESEGEYSLIFFNDRFSHAILKKPKSGDFRSQEEHGANIRCVEKIDKEVRHAAQSALDAIGETLLYTRVDLVRSQDGQSFQLMELELIEPALYFRTNKAAAVNFANAVNERQ